MSSQQQNRTKQWKEGVIRQIGWRIHDIPKQKLFAEIVPDHGFLPPWLRMIYQVNDVFTIAAASKIYSIDLTSTFLLHEMQSYVDLCDMLFF